MDFNPDISKKTVLITGGAKRIGAETSRTLHAAGMNIVIHYRSSQQQADELCYELNQLRDHSAAVIQGDLDDDHVYARMIEDAVRGEGGRSYSVDRGAIRRCLQANSQEMFWDFDAVCSDARSAGMGAIRARFKQYIWTCVN